MAEYALTDFLNLNAGVRANFDFGEEVSKLRLINRSYIPIQIFFRKNASTFNDDFTFILPEETRTFPFQLQDFDYLANQKAKLSVLGFLGSSGSTPGGGSLIIDFDKNTSSPLLLNSLVAGDFIRRITVVITEAFDPGSRFDLGFPSDNGFFFDDAKLFQKRIKEKTVMYKETMSKTLNLYLSGDPFSTGAGFVVIE